MDRLLDFYKKHTKTIIWSIIILILSFIRLPQNTAAELIPFADKIVHFILYLILGIIMAHEADNKLIAVIYIILLGMLIEIGQNELTTYRTGDYLDFLTDLVGGILGLYHKDIIDSI